MLTLSGESLDVFEHRYEWVDFHFTWTHLKLVLTKMLPVIASHSKSADEAEINSRYDRGFLFRFLSDNCDFLTLDLSRRA